MGTRKEAVGPETDRQLGLCADWERAAASTARWDGTPARDGDWTHLSALVTLELRRRLAGFCCFCGLAKVDMAAVGVCCLLACRVGVVPKYEATDGHVSPRLAEGWMT